ncbi:MAG: energy transducer TonB [Myxococcales bacterium]|jgi:TonB family protein
MSASLENLPSWALETGWVVLAIAVHVAFLGAMSHARPPADRPDPLANAVAVSIVDEPVVDEPTASEPEEPVEPPPPEQAPEPVEPPPRPKTFKAPKEPPKAPEEPPAAAPETPVAFDNLVLTNEGDEPSSWAVEPASGKSREGPIGRPDAVVSGRSRQGVAGGVIGGTGAGVVVDVGDLSKQPVPPVLKQKLEKLYPKKARQEGVEGEAVVRLQIGPDGLPSKIRVVSENPAGYQLGNACMKTLQGEKWQPPIGKDGKPVTTRVTYRCGFEIRY